MCEELGNFSPQFQGRILRMRGRGFTRAENVEVNPGNRNNAKKIEHDYGDNSNKKNNYGDCDDALLNKVDNKSIDIDQKNKKSENDIKKKDKEKPTKKERKQMNCNAENCFKTEDELFYVGVKPGANFEKFDEMEVNVSGKNIPKKIESFGEAGLLPLLSSNLKRSGYEKPTPIQKYALPIIMSSRDLMACSRAGSGKTAAFLIPLINLLLENKNRKIFESSAAPQLIIIEPTRELANQIFIEARRLTFGSSLITEICCGGTDLRQHIDRIKGGCNILVGTMGRLKDYLNRKVLILSEVRHIVIDEADQMLDKNFIGDIEFLFSNPSFNKNNKVQILMFSVTFPERIQQSAINYLKDYLFLNVGVDGSICSDVEQKFYLVSRQKKKCKLIDLLKECGSSKTIIFVKREGTLKTITTFLSENDFPSASLCHKMDLVSREEALKDFKCGKVNILVSTSVAGRGLDIESVSHVINYDLPNSVDEYIRRIGWTARIGNRMGLASSFFSYKTDSALAPDLLKILTQAQQEVPEFIMNPNNTLIGSRLLKLKKSPIKNTSKRNNDSYFEAVPIDVDEMW